MPLGMKVGLGPGHAVLDRDPAPLKKGAQQPPPTFRPMSYRGQTAGWIKMPLSTEVGLLRGDIVLDGEPAAPTKKRNGHSSPHYFAYV